MKKAFLQLHGAVLLAGFTGILGKLIHLNEGYLTFYRMLMSAILILGVLFATKSFHLPPAKSLLKLLGIGAIISLHWVGFYGSIKYSNVSVAVTCFSTVGFFTSLVEPAINRRKIDWNEVSLGLLVICGVYLIFSFYPQYKTGIIFGLISAFIASIFPIINKNMLRHHSPMVLNFLEMSGGTIALLFILPVYLHFFPATYFIPTVSDWIWLLFLSAACTVYAFDLSLQALKKISAFTVNLTFILEPVYSIILAFIIFKENQFLGIGFYAGFLLILSAVTIQMLRVRNEHRNRRALVMGLRRKSKVEN